MEFKSIPCVTNKIENSADVLKSRGGSEYWSSYPSVVKGGKWFEFHHWQKKKKKKTTPVQYHWTPGSSLSPHFVQIDYHSSIPRKLQAFILPLDANQTDPSVAQVHGIFFQLFLPYFYICGKYNQYVCMVFFIQLHITKIYIPGFAFKPASCWGTASKDAPANNNSH